jgi:hypothetical protein
MDNAPYSTPFRIASYVVLLLMAAAIVYSTMAVIHWFSGAETRSFRSGRKAQRLYQTQRRVHRDLASERPCAMPRRS